MRPLFFRGSLPSSKSLMNRALIAKSYFPHLEIKGNSTCEDVVDLENALHQLFHNPEGTINCGQGGTVLRFLALRASRQSGFSQLTGHKRLFARPQGELLNLFNQFGLDASLTEESLNIQSQGWVDPKAPIKVDLSVSSQFASSVLLNAWDLPFPLKLQLCGKPVSTQYMEMTVNFLQNLGMEIHPEKGMLVIPPFQKLKTSSVEIEPDMSSAFAVASCGLFCGETVFENFPIESLQPDSIFVQILQSLGVTVETETLTSKPLQHITLIPPEGLNPLEIDLSEQPDLFPILSVLGALTQGTSQIYGASQLQFKESHRIQKTAELLSLMNCRTRVYSDGLEIFGPGELSTRRETLLFDPDCDHRMAMAAAVAQKAGFPIQITTPSVVDKSFPTFWDIFRGTQ